MSDSSTPAADRRGCSNCHHLSRTCVPVLTRKGYQGPYTGPVAFWCLRCRMENNGAYKRVDRRASSREDSITRDDNGVA